MSPSILTEQISRLRAHGGDEEIAEATRLERDAEKSTAQKSRPKPASKSGKSTARKSRGK